MRFATKISAVWVISLMNGPKKNSNQLEVLCLWLHRSGNLPEVLPRIRVTKKLPLKLNRIKWKWVSTCLCAFKAKLSLIYITFIVDSETFAPAEDVDFGNFGKDSDNWANFDNFESANPLMDTSSLSKPNTLVESSPSVSSSVDSKVTDRSTAYKMDQ